MDQAFLNKVRIDEWDHDNVYEYFFKLKLTAKHALAVGKWEFQGYWGVDLRRWSLSEARLLAEGITINETTWKNICDLIFQMHAIGCFKNSPTNITGYEKKIPIDEHFDVLTTVFESPIHTYFCLNIHKNGQLVFKNRYTRCGIMIRFDTVQEFLTNCRRYNLFNKAPVVNGIKLVDKKTGKQIF